VSSFVVAPSSTTSLQKGKFLIKKIGAIVASVLALGIIAGVVMFSLDLLPYKGDAIQTGSMKPTIPPASLVIVGPGHYGVGDVIAFHKQDFIVVHRLIAINSDGTYTTKGDANDTEDAIPISKSQIIGVAIAHYDKLGFLYFYIKQPPTIAAMFLLLAFLYLVMSIMFEDSKDDEKRVSPIQVA
jgi:signal peptidase